MKIDGVEVETYREKKARKNYERNMIPPWLRKRPPPRPAGDMEAQLAELRYQRHPEPREIESKPDELLRDRMCTGKRAYRNPQHAGDVAKARGVELRIYACPFCRLFHLTKSMEVKT